MASVHVDVDIDDILWEMSSSEKRELCQELIDEGYGPKGVESQWLLPESYAEGELVSLFQDMWTNRIHVDVKLVDELKKLLRERNIL